MIRDGLYIHRIPGLTRLVRVEGGEAVYIGYDPDARRSRVGDIILGRVTRIENHLNAAFVNLGDGISGFLSAVDAKTGADFHCPGRRNAFIGDLVREGDAVLVQVLKDGVEGKSPRVTKSITLGARHMVLTPGDKAVRLSKRIERPDRRAALEKTLSVIGAETGAGVVVRNLAEDPNPDLLIDAHGRLIDIWTAIEARAKTEKPPATLRSGGGLLRSAVFDVRSEDAIFVGGWGDDDCNIEGLIRDIAPDMTTRLARNRSGGDVFEELNLDVLFEEALESSVILPDHGRIHIDKARAAWMIDVDMADAKSSGRKPDAAYRLNWNAAERIAKEIVLRGLNGLILIDFLRMKGRDRRNRVADRMRRDLMKAGRDAHVLGFTPAGILEIGITRTNASLEDVMREADPDHPGARRFRADVEAFEAILRMDGQARHYRGQMPVLKLDAAIRKVLNGSAEAAFKALSARLGFAPTIEVFDRPPRIGPEIHWRKRERHG